MRIEVAGENALIIYFAEETSPEVSAQIQQAAIGLEQMLGDKLVDLIPSYASLLVIYDALRCDHLWVGKCIRQVYSASDTSDHIATDAINSTGKGSNESGKVVELPVWYDPESGPDLESLAQNAGLTPEEVIAIHQSSDYRVYAIGFAPGFAYLGQVDERIAAPRLASPRLKVPRGAVAIADRQTAVYPDVSPGGWNLIGLCPTRMFDPQATPTMPVSVGDSVRFKAIDRDEFFKLGGELP
ncbi:MAG: 5-oxoprolinase subunit PxpB [Thiolinea sp.]